MASRELQSLREGPGTREAFRRWLAACLAYDQRLEDQGVPDLWQQLRRLHEDEAAAGRRNGLAFEQQCAALVADWLEHSGPQCQKRDGIAVLLSNVSFKDVTTPGLASAEFDLMVAWLSQGEVRDSTEQQRLETDPTQRTHGRAKLIWASAPLLPSPRTRQDVEVLAVVECKNSPKQVAGHVAKMTRGLAFFSGMERDVPSACPFTLGLLPLKEGLTLAFTPWSFRAFGNEEGRLARLLYITQEGKLGPCSALSFEILELLMRQRSFDALGRITTLPEGLVRRVARRHAEEERRMQEAGKLLLRLAELGNLWMVPGG